MRLAGHAIEAVNGDRTGTPAVDPKTAPRENEKDGPIWSLLTDNRHKQKTGLPPSPVQMPRQRKEKLCCLASGLLCDRAAKLERHDFFTPAGDERHDGA